MVIDKILNNNVVISKNAANEEIIYMGCGLAFKKKIGDSIDPMTIEKEFILKDSVTARQFQQLFADVPTEEIEVIKQIVDLAEKNLHIELLQTIYLTLTDHIHYALLRARKGIELPNPLLFETRKFYPKEFAVAEEAVEKIHQVFNIQLPESEIGFIAFHIVNSEQANQTMQVTMQSVEIARDILSIIHRFLGKTLNPDSLNYQRIVTHLNYFVKRYLTDELSLERDEFLFALIQSKYPKSFQTVQQITNYLIKTYGKSVGETEKIYLTIHIERIANDKK
ncbi:transcription antiterminator LicT [Melissococcus plutonius]|uniref:Beta-glucoside Bgl operon antiterminator, BglG family n=1 Tax=Melissococcus plutonius (strain ATCC 35311 / DSM 29964 / CIP 104052 / LMG 20360 / NCIMB 702443) TaxID=940190 RepID=F3Y8U4_MELPT|nr:PRD domain-containing protein [Melissococcus plutonius]AIM24566.1 transcription antiterminator LicT [Melissococcus plutonius S1]KMT24643.1 transcription antiterminator LicT [Melissococcus plutonius]KMT27356.1 transcription antiterminator LicT [Melissococcus plutonius]KMT27529.1 transcription antiterminator LicT [Melissococcus plutonius]KMT29303.1 transcription antiterminator LicT [Melissococcus plutonius]